MANGGIIGPVVTPPNVQTQSAPGVWTLQEAQEYIRQGLWPRRYDPLYNYTTLLLSGNGANNATNNSFLDSSSNNFTVTRNGNTTQGTFSPFSQTGWGNYFDGTGDYLSVADNSVLRLGTSNFTIECWVNRAANGTAHSILAKGGASTGWLLEVTSGNVLQFTHTTTTITTSLPVYAGNWVHVAAVREGTGSNQFKLYINGTLAQTATMATDFTQTDTLYIGANRSAATTMNGYISNVRIVNGTALYTAQFTPSTTPLTTTSQGATAAQVELLTCQSNRFLDNSGNGFTVTPAGNSAVVAFSPFNATRPWDPLTYGGSGYFDGSGDYLSAASNTALNLTGDYTVECWFYANSFPTQPTLFGIGSDAAGLVLTIFSSKVYAYLVGVGNVFGSGGTTLITNSWNHIAIVRSGTTNTCYINGSQSGTTYSSSSTISSTGGVGIGRTVTGSSFNDWNGYVADFRIVKGTAVYTGAFTPPTAPLTAITNTSLLLNFTNIGITDATSKNTLETVGDAKISTAQSKFGGSSIAFDGTGDYLFSRYSTLYDLGGGDFTIEAWVYFSSLPSNNYVTLVSYGNSVSAQRFLFYYDTRTSFSSPGLRFSVLNASNSLIIDVNGGGTSGWSANTWYHVCITRSGSSFKLFRDGVQNGSTVTDTDSIVDVTANGFYVGVEPNGSNGIFNGYIQDLRITKGVARYKENFAVPDSAFATLGNTPPSVDPYFDYTTLLLPGSGSNNATNNSFLDSSANNFTITRNGNTTQGTFSPFSQTGWGNYFGGSAALTAGSASDWAFMSNTTALWSVEMWVYPTTSGSQTVFLDTNAGASASIGVNIYKTTSNAVGISITRGVSGSVVINSSSTGTLTTNAWNYVLITYDQSLASGNLNIYINGGSAETFNKTANTPSSSNPTYTLNIGRAASAIEYFTGYLSNIRISNVIRSSTVPTSPLASDGNTKLLTCQSNRFRDASSNTYAITLVGSPSVQAFSPFNPSASWSAATYGGSGYFDGSGDYLTVPQSAGALDLGSGQFSLEFWWYPTSAATSQYPFIGESTGDWYVGVENNNIGLGRRGVTVDVNTTGFTLAANTWQHFVIARQSTGSNDTRIFVNGVLNGVGTTSQNYTIATTLRIGGQTGGSINGYLSSTNLVKGSVPAAYQTSSTTTGTQIFTPPTSPSTSVTGTQLLLNYTNAGIYDATSKNDLETVADAKISTAQSVWTAYGSSMSFDGTGDWLTVIDQPVLRFGTGNFTIEMWLYLNATGAARGLVGKGDASNGWLVSLNSSNNVVFTYGTSTITSTGTISASVWTNITVVREGTSTNQTKIYINGTNDGTGTVSTDFTQTNTMYVGANRTGGDALNGYLQDLRITRWARYTSAFQPPSAPLALR